MWLFVMVVIMLGSVEVIDGFSDHVLPPVARWGWWTLTLAACGLASIAGSYAKFWQKVLGLVSISLFYISYPLLWSDYVEMIPRASEAALWGNVFIVANVIIPLLMVTMGPLLPVVRRG